MATTDPQFFHPILPDTAQTPASILLVDDVPENLRLLSNILTEAGYRVRKVLNGQLALNSVEANPPNLIFLDIMMPEMDGYQVCEILKSDPKTKDIPILFISALNDTFDKVKAFEVGGVDYIVKPFHVEEVLVRVRHQLEIQSARLQIQTLNAELEQRVAQRTSELQQAQYKLLHMAMHDPLTHLPNRTLFLQELEQAIQRHQTQPEYQFAVLFLDGNRIKVVNDSLGHLLGDQLIANVARRLQSCCHPTDILARLGGDEFTLLVTNVDELESVIQMAEAIQASMEHPFNLQGHEIFISFSIGICWGQGYQRAEDILRDADTAMYRAKDSETASYKVFDQKMHQEVLVTLQTENDLRRAIEQTEFAVYYQPILQFNPRQVMGFEALVRWVHPERCLISPGQFIPIAEDTNLIVPIGFWVLQSACQQFQTWRTQGLVAPSAQISVNLSTKQLNLTNLNERVSQILTETHLPPACLKLEITEGTVMQAPDRVIQILNQFRHQGIQISVDDFGTGYSSLAYLHRFPLNTLKIDRAFVMNLAEAVESQGIVKAIIALAQTLGMNTIAEGVETQAEIDQLQQMGCDMGQGYLFAKPLPIDVATDWLKQQRA
ncbi:MAG: EAL domain-containing protein [Microcoleaceae cyanobacterium]